MNEQDSPIRIDPQAFYDASAVRLLLRVTSAALTNARKTGALRGCRRGTQTFFKGQWLLDWLERGDAREEAHNVS